MDKDYEGYWQGIAVHNGDPMTDPDYDNGMAPYILDTQVDWLIEVHDIDPGALNKIFYKELLLNQME